MELAQISQLAVAVSAALATVTFLLSVRKDFLNRRRDDIREWQVVVMHRAFVQQGPGWISFKALMSIYRSEASAFPGHTVNKSELSEDSLRRVLTDMVRGRLIDQRVGDEYQLYSVGKPLDDFPMGGFGEVMQAAMTGMTAQIIAAQEGKSPAAIFSKVDDLVTERTSKELAVHDRAINIVADDPYRYSVSDLVLRLSRDLTIDAEIVRSKLLTMVRSGSMQETDERLHLD